MNKLKPTGDNGCLFKLKPLKPDTRPKPVPKTLIPLCLPKRRVKPKSEVGELLCYKEDIERHAEILLSY